jgi:tetratricopeptide (TPR) repeat protein
MTTTIGAEGALDRSIRTVSGSVITDRPASRPTVCLTMIVRDEAAVVAEGLAAAIPHIDTWCIVDTGSTDATCEVIERLLDDAGIPGELHHRPWRDFGHNRTEALELARPLAAHRWMLDADDLVTGALDLSGLWADAHDLRFGPALEFWRTQIFRSDRDWVFEGVVHEYPRCLDGPAEIARVEGDYAVVFRSIGARSRRPDKYERDAALLRAAAESDPANPRTAFYLGQSYRDAGLLHEALEWYERRASMEGWPEETYCALLERARLLERLDEPHDVVVLAYLEAWRARPSRVEALADLARTSRVEGDHLLAHLVASYAEAIPFPDDDRLFVERDAHAWRITDSRAISAHYVGRPQEALDLCQALLEGPDLPEEERARVHRNRDFAVEVVAPATTEHPAELVATLADRHRRRRPPGDVTVTITSCRRLDLFEATMSSFLRCAADDLADVARWVCVDDRSSAADRARMQERFPFLELVGKGDEDAGHARSMNLLRGLVDTELWLHLEDDWHFVVRSRLISRARAVLDHDPDVAQVLFNRNYAETLEDRDLVGGDVGRTDGGVRYRRHVHLAGEELDRAVAALEPGQRTNVWWPHYSLRPSLSRTEALVALGPFDEAAPHPELDLAHRFTAAGLRAAFLDDVVCLHTGPLTSDRGPDRRPDAYVLNDQVRFGPPSTGS